MQEPGDAEGNKGYAFGIFAGKAKRTTYVKYFSSCYFLLLYSPFMLSDGPSGKNFPFCPGILSTNSTRIEVRFGSS